MDVRVNEEVVLLPDLRADEPDDLLQTVPGLYRVAFALTGNRPDAEDLVHTAVERYLAATQEGPADLGAYLRRTMTNLHLNAVKRRGIHRRSMATLRGDRQAPTADLDLRPDIFSALQTLAPLPRAVVVLRYLADLPVDDVARTLGRPAGTVRRLAHHALAELRLSPTLRPFDEVSDDHE